LYKKYKPMNCYYYNPYSYFMYINYLYQNYSMYNNMNNNNIMKNNNINNNQKNTIQQNHESDDAVETQNLIDIIGPVLVQLGGREVNINIKSVVENKFVAAENGGGRELVANRDVADIWETFTATILPNNMVILRSYNGQYVRVRENDGVLLANADNRQSATRFTIVRLEGNEMAVQAPNGQYVRVRENDKWLVARADDTGRRTRFIINTISQVPSIPDIIEDILQEIIGQTGRERNVTIKSVVENKFVAAENGGGRELVANRDVADIWETFKITNTGNNNVILQSYNGQYIRVRENDGVLLANANNRQSATRFKIIRLEGREVALQAPNGQYVRVRESDKWLVARAGQTGRRTRFIIDRITQPIDIIDDLLSQVGRERNINIKSVVENKFVAAENGGGRELVANRDVADIWENFKAINAGNNNIILQSYNGQYVRVRGNDGVLLANADNRQSATRFRVVRLDNNEIALQAPNGQYVRVRENDKWLVARADQTGRRTRFTISRANQPR
jgi:glycerophosphoryl diester phosphodiesterase